MPSRCSSNGPTSAAVFIAVGGGGLVSGMAAHIKSVRPDISVIGCWPERGASMYESIRAGRLVDVPDEPTLSDGTAGNVEPGSITFPLCRDLIDELVLVSEAEIAAAMRDVMLADHMVIEGAAGVAVAAWRKFTADRPAPRRSRECRRALRRERERVHTLDRPRRRLTRRRVLPNDSGVYACWRVPSAAAISGRRAARTARSPITFTT